MNNVRYSGEIFLKEEQSRENFKIKNIINLEKYLKNFSLRCMHSLNTRILFLSLSSYTIGHVIIKYMSLLSLAYILLFI